MRGFLFVATTAFWLNVVASYINFNLDKPPMFILSVACTIGCLYYIIKGGGFD